MKTSIYISLPTEEEKKLLREEGCSFCECCNFKGVTFLSYSQNQFHGIGYGCENECKNKNCTLCNFHDSLNSGNLIIFKDIKDFLEYKKKYDLS